MITDYLYHLGILDLMEEMIPLDLVVIAIQIMTKMTPILTFAVSNVLEKNLVLPWKSWNYAGCVRQGETQPTNAMPEFLSKSFNYGSDVPPVSDNYIKSNGIALNVKYLNTL